MHVVALLEWWYGAGWVDQRDVLRLRLAKISDYFSIPLLLRTLFQPFRQTDALAVRGGLEVQLRAGFDKLLSRTIGAMTRGLMVLVGCVWWAVSLLIGICWLLLWPFLPALPVFGVVLTEVFLP